MIRNHPGRPPRSERGIVIVLVAVIMLFVVGAMAALAIDVVTLYTARSEAQLAADSAALAGARVLANSGMTSGPDTTIGVNAAPLAIDLATRVAASNQVGDRHLSMTGACGPGAEICVTIDTAAANFLSDPQVVVQVQRADLPTFFSRIWGRTALTVRASATAEAYNPSNEIGPRRPVSPSCVKPWILPNMDPTNGGLAIFDGAGRINAGSTLLGWTTGAGTFLTSACQSCIFALPSAAPWQYYPGDLDDFPPPPASSVACPGCAGFNDYQRSIAGCVRTPISCKGVVHVDVGGYPGPSRDADTADAVNKMTHSLLNKGDSVNPLNLPSPPFQFVAGADNPLVLTGALAPSSNIMVSDSIVTVPVVNWIGSPTEQVVGFVQLFLNQDGLPSAIGQGKTQVINLVGCGAGTFGRTILGNGSSPVAVRLVAGP